MAVPVDVENWYPYLLGMIVELKSKNNDEKCWQKIKKKKSQLQTKPIIIGLTGSSEWPLAVALPFSLSDICFQISRLLQHFFVLIDVYMFNILSCWFNIDERIQARFRIMFEMIGFLSHWFLCSWWISSSFVTKLLF